MAYTQADIDAIDRAIALGATTVIVDGKTVTYRSLDELVKARSIIVHALQPAAKRRPRAAFKRAHYRRLLSYYEAARPDSQRKQRRETGSADSPVLKSGRALREQARHLEQNHDLARGALNLLIANVVGPYGIQIEPQPRTQDGDIHEDLVNGIRDLWHDWAFTPEVTWFHDWASVQRMVCRSWIRDGEALAQLVEGTVQTLNHDVSIHGPFFMQLGRMPVGVTDRPGRDGRWAAGA